EVRPAVIEERRARLLCATADWSDDRFAGPLVQAVGAIAPQAPITLACSCPAGAADETIDAILRALRHGGIDPDADALCDLTVVEEGEADWRGLVLAADAVLVLDE